MTNHAIDGIVLRYSADSATDVDRKEAFEELSRLTGRLVSIVMAAHVDDDHEAMMVELGRHLTLAPSASQPGKFYCLDCDSHYDSSLPTAPCPARLAETRAYATALARSVHRLREVLDTQALSAELLSLGELERREIKRAVRITRGNKAEAARLLGIDRKTLYRKLAALAADDTPPAAAPATTTDQEGAP